MKISVILPTYNEEGNIGRLIKEILKYIKNVEIVVVDDDSTDQTVQEIKDLNLKSIKLIERKERGLATAIRRGIENSTGDLIVLMDTDFNHSPKNLPRLISESQHFDLVIGSRFVKGGGMRDTKMRYCGSYILNLFSRILLRLPVHDTESGFLIINKSIFEKINLNKIFYGYGDYCIRLLYFVKKAGIRIKEVPVIYEKRVYGKSKTRLIKHLIQYIKTIIKLLIKKQI